MPVFDTYDSRLRRTETAGQPEVYTYDLPPFLRKQLSQVFTACIGPGHRPRPYEDISGAPPNANATWDRIARILDRELPSFESCKRETSYEWCMAYLQGSPYISGVLSLIEICCRLMGDLAQTPDYKLANMGIREAPGPGLKEVNERFKNAGVGYQFEAGEIVRVDSQYLHSEVVKPALQLLAAPEFAEANREFRLAHEHFRSGTFRDCNAAALRALEGLLKAICHARGWQYDSGATVEKLIGVVRANGLFPDYLGGYFDNLIGAMKAGLPKIRDKDGGHGAAPGQPAVQEHIAGFALHLAASNIVMLGQAYRALPAPARR